MVAEAGPSEARLAAPDPRVLGWGDVEPALHLHDREEDLDAEPRAKRWAPGPGQAREHRLVDPEPARAPEEQPAEVRVVEAHHEAPEIVIPPPHRALIGGEASGREITGSQPHVDGLPRFEAALHGQQHAGREDRGEEAAPLTHPH